MTTTERITWREAISPAMRARAYRTLRTWLFTYARWWLGLCAVTAMYYAARGRAWRDWSVWMLCTAAIYTVGIVGAWAVTTLTRWCRYVRVANETLAMGAVIYPGARLRWDAQHGVAVNADTMRGRSEER